MSDDTQKLEILVGLYELAISRLFETVPEGGEAKRLFVEDVRQLLDRSISDRGQSPKAKSVWFSPLSVSSATYVRCFKTTRTKGELRA